MRRVLIGARLQLVAWPSVIGWPWLVLAAAFATNVALFAAIGPDARERSDTYGISSIYVVFVVGYIQSMTQVFPFAIGYGLTRRAFYASMSLLAVAASIVYAVVLGLLSRIEIATDGWGTDVRFFLPRGVDAGGLWQQVAVYAVPFLLLAFIGICIGLVSKRWGTNGLLAVGTSTVVVIGAAVVGITVADLWDSIGRQIADASTTEVWAVWPLPIVAVLAAAGRLGIRRAAP